jgi:hypothetical protein
MTDGIWPDEAGFVGQRGAGTGMYGPVDVLAGDLAVAGEAVGIGGGCGQSGCWKVEV